jgi:membrane protein
MPRFWTRARAWLQPLIVSLTRGRTLGLAAEMAFWIFLAMVPLAAVAGFAAARVATSNESVLPSLLSSLPEAARDLIVNQVRQVAAWRGGALAPVAVATFVWLASSGVQAIFDALEVQSGTSRPWWKRRLLALLACILLSVGVAGAALLVSGLGWLRSLLGRAAPIVFDAEGAAVRNVLGRLAAAALAVGMVAALYRIGIPREARSRMALLPGAVLAVILQGAMGWTYGTYVGRFGEGGAYLAGLAVIAVTLMTLWLFSVALLLGATFNGVVAERRRNRGGGRAG